MTADEALADMKRQIAETKKKFAARGTLEENNKTIAVTNACIRVESMSKRLMRATYTAYSYTNPKTGRLVRNTRPRSIPGAAPAPNNGTLMRSITHDVQTHFGETFGRVGSTIRNPPYPAYLENGTSKMAARPWLLPSLLATRSKFGAEVKAAVKDTPLAELISGSD